MSPKHEYCEPTAAHFEWSSYSPQVRKENPTFFTLFTCQLFEHQADSNGLPQVSAVIFYFK